MTENLEPTQPRRLLPMGSQGQSGQLFQDVQVVEDPLLPGSQGQQQSGTGQGVVEVPRLPQVGQSQQQSGMGPGSRLLRMGSQGQSGQLFQDAQVVEDPLLPGSQGQQQPGTGQGVVEVPRLPQVGQGQQQPEMAQEVRVTQQAPPSQDQAERQNSQGQQQRNSGNGQSSGGGGSDGSSSNGNVFVNTDALAAGIPIIRGLMQRLKSISDYASGTIGGLNLNRGDSYGDSFASVNDPMSGQLLGGLNDASSVFGDTADGADSMRSNYINTENNNVDSAGDFSRSSEG